MACLISCVTPTRSQNMPLSLAECRRMALANSEDMRMADNAARQAELDIKIANTAMLPKFDASAMGMYMVPDMDMSIAKLQMHGTYLAGINIVQPIYAGENTCRTQTCKNREGGILDKSAKDKN